MTLSKIANDLRLMSSGPRTGFGEINLPARQNGSSIMPGKVNPVIPEVINQVAFLIIGNDMTVTMAAEGGQLELNAFEPIFFYCLFQSIGTLTYAVHTFVDNCVTGITANEERCRELVESSVGVITALTPHIGYQHAADIAKRAIVTGQSVRKLILQEKLLTEEEIDTILDPMNLTKPGIPGKNKQHTAEPLVEVTGGSFYQNDGKMCVSRQTAARWSSPRSHTASFSKTLNRSSPSFGRSVSKTQVSAFLFSQRWPKSQRSGDVSPRMVRPFPKPVS